MSEPTKTPPNPLEMLQTMLESEAGKALMEKGEDFENYARAALKDVYTIVVETNDRLAVMEAKLNLISSNVVTLRAH